MVELTNKEFFQDLDQTIAAQLFEQTTYPWEILPLIKDFVLEVGPTLSVDEYDQVEEDVWIAKSAGNALIGAGCVVGNSTEIKNDILFNNVQVPHYNYVGDSILGYKSHMGAGSITSNVKSDKTNVVIKNGEEKIETGRKKIGAILSSRVEVGCGTILNPGSVVGHDTNIYPLSMVRGCIAPNSIYKNAGEIAQKR